MADDPDSRDDPERPRPARSSLVSSFDDSASSIPIPDAESPAGVAGAPQSPLSRLNDVVNVPPGRAQELLEAARRSQSEADTGEHPGRILVVEDDPDGLKVLREFLEQAGYEVVTAADGAEGFARASVPGENFDLAVVDVVMPVMSGTELVAQLRSLQPAMKVLFISAIVERHAQAADRDVSFLAKPFRPETLREKLRELLGE